MKLMPMLFEIDCLEGKYSGYTSGQTWNGWECPYFTFDVAHQFAQDFNALSADKIIYIADKDMFVCHFDGYSEEEQETFESTTIDGLKLYAVGAGSWTWDGELI
ncbi:TPA: hypothetical protein QDB06_000831 [Burkholderia vietnamiensis]|nr:hypothetical protein [Burkholderia vietnamiensis]